MGCGHAGPRPYFPPHAACWEHSRFIQIGIIVSDIMTDPLWDQYRHLAVDHGLRACWSTPIFSTTRGVLGTFALYSDRNYRFGHHDRPTMGSIPPSSRRPWVAGMLVHAHIFHHTRRAGNIRALFRSELSFRTS